MKMWEIREGYEDRRSRSRDYDDDRDYRYGMRSTSKDYECGYEDGYEDAMKEAEKRYR